MSTEPMSTKERSAMFKAHYECSGRDMPKSQSRKDMKWDKELGRDATKSKG